MRVTRRQFYPTPTKRERIAFTKTFTEDEFHRLYQSIRPETMDQRWYCVLNDGWLYVVRNWTDRCFFQLRIHTEPPHQIVEAWTLWGGERHRGADVTGESEQLNQVNQAIDEILTAEGR